METENELRLGEVFVGIPDPRQNTKVQYDLVGTFINTVT